jgi:DNA-binding transcriptional MerR regulator
MDVLYPHRKFSGNASELAEKAIECATNFGWTVDLDKTNERLVRYYVTEGVIDRPDRQGRDASYNFRHLLQLLTARRMVEHGMSLNVIGRHNTLAPTQGLEEGLAGPIPTEAEILVNSFKSPDAARNFSPKFKAASAPAPLSLPDVLHELKRMQNDWMAEIGFVKKLRDDFDRLKHEMLEHRKLAENAQSRFYAHFTEIAAKGAEQHERFMQTIIELIHKNGHEVNLINKKLGSAMEDRLEDIRKRQDHLIYVVETMQKNTYSLTSSQPTTTSDNTGEKL